MAIFEGTIQEFHDFIGPRITNKIQNFTRTHKKRLKNGICERCNEPHELDAAHKHGRERRLIIEEVLAASLINDKIKCDISAIEKEILNAHVPVEKIFKFLCRSCHKAYDKNKPKQQFKKHPKPDNFDGNFTKINRIQLWAKRPNQVNHKIIKAFLELENKGDVHLHDLRETCSSKDSRYLVDKFDENYASMKSDAGNSHGNVFYDDKGIVFIHSRVRDEIKRHFKPQ